MAKPITIQTFFFAISLLLFGACKLNETIKTIEKEEIEIPSTLKTLEKHYGNHFDVLNANQIVWKDGDTLVFDDGKKKEFATVLVQADIEDQFRIAYPKCSHIVPPNSTFDPGRIRNQKFFQKMYGATKEEVKSNLDTIIWLPKHTDVQLPINSINGCADSLKLVSDALQNLPDSLLKYVIKTAGTFNYRHIAGTQRLSCHSYGIAIDINVDYSNYWRWDKGEYHYRNKIPFEIVDIFEKYGFIWGGYWYHYDTMHFEFRPELLESQKLKKELEENE